MTPFSKMSAVPWRALRPYLAMALGALLLRLLHLTERPLHHDESMHALYGYEIAQYFKYKYIPFLHGPVLYYLAACGFSLFGASDFTARLMPVLSGSCLCLLPYFLRSHLGKIGAFSASVFLALSPTFFYFSRFLRHDIYSELLHALMLIAVVSYARQPRRWPIIVAPLCLTLSFANHELAYISLFLIALYLAAYLWKNRAWQSLGKFLAAHRRTCAWAFISCVATYVLLFSSFFTNGAGVLNGLPNPFSKTTSLGYWLSQHHVQRGNQPIYYYAILLLAYEFLPLGLFLIAIGHWRKVCTSPLRAFLLYWALGSLIIYSWAGERMPWLLMHPLLPMLLLAGYLFGQWWEARHYFKVSAVIALLALTTIISLRLNYCLAADPRELLVYVQTAPDTWQVLDEIAKLKTSKTAPVKLVLDNEITWPYAWYLRHEKILAYEPNLRNRSLSPELFMQANAILIHTLTPDEAPKLPEPWQFKGRYDLRRWWTPNFADFNPLTHEGLYHLWRWFYKREVPQGLGSMFFCLYVRNESNSL